jgi:hypothetical protein
MVTHSNYDCQAAFASASASTSASAQARDKLPGRAYWTFFLAPVGSSASLRWVQAAACFQEAAEAEPASLKALGNWGNALLEHGKVHGQCTFHGSRTCDINVLPVSASC